MTSANSVVKIARSQIGVYESPAGSNRQKYGKAYGWNGTYWCAQFVWWCGYKAGSPNVIAKSASAAYIQDNTVSKGGSWVMKKNKSSDKRLSYARQAMPGDVVSFDFGAMDAVRDHVGLVESVDGDTIICIEGNTSKSGSQSNGGMVCRQKRPTRYICSAVRPKYEKPAIKDGDLEVDGDFGYQTAYRLQKWLGVTQDADIGTKTIKALQKELGVAQDGLWCHGTTEALQKKLSVTADGIFGKKSIKALQRHLNKMDATKTLEVIGEVEETVTTEIISQPVLYAPQKGELCYDLSAWQGKLSTSYFKGIKEKGIKCVILRSSYTHGDSFEMSEDKYFDNNVQNAIKAGMHIGIYHFSQATTEDEAKKEAKFCIKCIKPYMASIDLPVAFDWESYKRLTAKIMKSNGKTKNGKIVNAFCNKIRKAGYEPMVYASLVVFNNYLPYNIYKSLKIWVAQYYKECQYKFPYYMWQLTSNNGKLDENVFGTQDTEVTKTTKTTETAEPTKLDRIHDTAVKLAWAFGTKKSVYSYPDGRAKKAFQKAIKEVYPNRNNWSKQPSKGASCDVFVGTVVRASGVDKKFPRGLDEVIPYVNKHPKKWKKLKIHKKSKMKPGDIIYQIFTSGNGHISIYLGGNKIANAHYYGKTYGIIQKYDNHVKSASNCKEFYVLRPK